MRRLVLTILALLLTGCLAGSDRNRASTAPGNGSSLPKSGMPPARSEIRACLAELDRDRIDYSPVPDQFFGGGCQITGAVQLVDIGVPVTGLTAMQCGLARAFAGWSRYAIAPAARQILGSDLVRIETFGSYACRNVIGNAASAGRLSGHATANAVDVSGFVLADGRRISVQTGWTSADQDIRTFLRVIHTSACKRFGTVLSPDYNAAHYNHLHLEDDHAGFCR